EQRESTLCDGAKQLHQALVARPIDCGRTQNDVFHSHRGGRPAHLLFRRELAALVIVPWSHRRALVDDPADTLSVDPGGAAVNEPSNTLGARRSRHVRGALDVDAMEELWILARLPERGREMAYAIAGAHCSIQGLD